MKLNGIKQKTTHCSLREKLNLAHRLRAEKRNEHARVFAARQDPCLKK